MKILASVALLSLLGLLSGCSGSDGGSGDKSNGGFSSSLSDKAVIGSLPNQDAATLCKEVNGSPFVSAVLGHGCLSAALQSAAASKPKTDADARTACSKIYDPCIKSDVPDVPCDSQAQCTATVGEFEQCLNDNTRAYTDLTATLPACAELTLATLGKVDFSVKSPAEPASCDAFAKKCP